MAEGGRKKGESRAGRKLKQREHWLEPHYCGHPWASMEFSLLIDFIQAWWYQSISLGHYIQNILSVNQNPTHPILQPVLHHDCNILTDQIAL